jgi:hypothetical protein
VCKTRRKVKPEIAAEKSEQCVDQSPCMYSLQRAEEV